MILFQILKLHAHRFFKEWSCSIFTFLKVAAKAKLATKTKQERNERKEQWINVIMIQHV